jgi:hypothetical protein
LSGRVSPELRHLQATLAAQLPYRQAAALLGVTCRFVKNRTLRPSQSGCSQSCARR